jgi:hypothetical protein
LIYRKILSHPDRCVYQYRKKLFSNVAKSIDLVGL